MTEIVLTGLDGSNPLAFFAALGVLNVLSDRAGADAAGPELLWRDDGVWRPVVRGRDARAELVQAIMDDLTTWRDEPAIQLLRYHKADKKGEKAPKAAWDLKPPPDVFAEYLRRLVSRTDAGNRRSIDFAAAFATDVAVDGSGNTKPTALHFTAGQQEFLKMVGDLIEGVNAADVEEALFGPWRYARELPVLQWDCTAARDYALRASDPSKDKKTGVPGADWLAFRGLSFLRVAPVRTQVHTTGCSGGWKTGRFRWPLWSVPLGRAAVHTALQLRGLEDMRDAERRERGIAAVFKCSIRRSDQGGYGSFTPSTVV